MAIAALFEQAEQEAWSDEQVVSRVLAGETALARSILRKDAEAEDVI